jgi:hypothetical protein
MANKTLKLGSQERLGATIMPNENNNLPVIMPSKGAGVKRYIPYCPAMPEKFDGFVWF